MPKLKVLSGKELIKIFSEFGFSIQSQKGSHIILSRQFQSTKQVLVIPNHTEIDVGTLKAIYRQAGKYISETELNPFFIANNNLMSIKLNQIVIGDNNPFVLIAGPCVVENEKMIFETAIAIKQIAADLDIPFIFKSSFKKANRTNLKSFTGLGDKESVAILKKVRDQLNLSVVTDIHTESDVDMVIDAVDILQIPAFLSRQTDLLIAAGKSGKVVNIKKGQFLAPEDMKHAVDKVASTGNNKIMLTERGTTFGYHNLVVDMRSLVIMRELGYPVVMDATHAVQLPSKDLISGGQPKFIKPLARAAMAVGIDALFLEVHPDPENALSDAASQLPLGELKELLIEMKQIDQIIKNKK